MGCDIHLYVERKNRDAERYNPVCRFGIGRDYHLFALIAGVRNWNKWDVPYPPRGFPDNATYEAKDEYNQIEYGKAIPNPDWHTPSWLITSEMKRVLELYKEVSSEKNEDLLILCDLLESIEQHYMTDARVVFWFDN